MVKIHLPDSFCSPLMKREILALSWQHDENKRKNIIPVPDIGGFPVCVRSRHLHGSGRAIDANSTGRCN